MAKNYWTVLSVPDIDSYKDLKIFKQLIGESLAWLAPHKYETLTSLEIEYYGKPGFLGEKLFGAPVVEVYMFFGEEKIVPHYITEPNVAFTAQAFNFGMKNSCRFADETIRTLLRVEEECSK